MNRDDLIKAIGSGHAIIDVDLDGVCVDYLGAFRLYVSERYGIASELLRDPHDYDLTKAQGWPFATRDDYLAAHREAVAGGLYRGAPIYEGVKEGFAELDRMGFHIRIVTHRLFLSGMHRRVIEDTVAWLEGYELPFMSLCFLGPKDTLRANVHVEDSPSVIRRLQEAGENVFIFDQPYNRVVNGIRFCGWSEMVDYMRERVG